MRFKFIYLSLFIVLLINSINCQKNEETTTNIIDLNDVENSFSNAINNDNSTKTISSTVKEDNTIPISDEESTTTQSNDDNDLSTDQSTSTDEATTTDEATSTDETTTTEDETTSMDETTTSSDETISTDESTTTEETTTSVSLPNDETTQDEETSSFSTEEQSDTTTSTTSTTITTTTTEEEEEETTTSTEPTSIDSQLEQTVDDLDKNLVDDDSSVKKNYETIDVTKSLNTPHTITIEPIHPVPSQIFEVKHIKNLDEQYEIEMKIESKDLPVSFKQCIISTVDAPNKVVANKTGQCLESYNQIHKSEFYVIVKRWLITRPIKISFRVVISGCNATKVSSNQNIRDIIYDPRKPLPRIVHQSDNECTYRIKNQHSDSHMMMSTLISYPKDLECHTFVKVSSTNLPTDYTGQIQLLFDSLNSTMAFSHGILVSKEYIIIKTANCKKNLHPIVLSVTSLKKSFKMINFGKPGSSDSEVLDSKQLMPAKEENFLAEIVNDNSRDLIIVELSKYTIHDQKECSDDFKTSILTIFALNEQNILKIKQFNCDSSMPYETLNFKGYKRVFIQFYRVNSDQDNEKSQTLDNFEINVHHIRVKKFSEILQTPNKYISSENRRSTDFENSQFDFQIKAPKNHRIILEIEKFINGQPMFLLDCLRSEAFNDLSECLRPCEDNAYMTIKMDYSLSKNQLNDKSKDELLNPKFCNIVDGMKTFYSHSNILTLSMIYSTPLNPLLYENPEKPPQPAFNFTFRFEPVCDNVYGTIQKKPIITFDSTRSVSNYDETGSCQNTITTSIVRRIVLYKTDWFGNDLLLNEDYNFGSVPNGDLICRNSDSFSVSDLSPKYQLANKKLMNMDMPNVYCHRNPFNSYISKSNVLYLNYRKRSNETIVSNMTQTSENEDEQAALNERVELDELNRDLVFEYGYFTYKYLYTNTDRRMVVNFNEIIPDNINTNVIVDSLDFKIKAADGYYIVPTIKNCRTKLKTGQILIIANDRSIDFNRDCKGQSYLLFSGTSVQQIEFIFKKVNLTELVENNIGFTVDYETNLKVMKDLKGSFSSKDFTNKLSYNKFDSVTFEWLIDVDPNYYVRLNIDKLDNTEKIEDLTIYDYNTNELFYDKQSIIPSFRMLKFKNYILPTNKLLVTFKFNYKTPTDNLPFLNISYVCEPRSILLTEKNPFGELTFIPAFQRDNLIWTITAPKDYQIQVKVTDYLNRNVPISPTGQLKFSYLSQSYTYDGTYFFDLKPIKNDSIAIYDRPADVVISKDNILHILYMTKGLSDSFKLVYSMIRKVYTEPTGLITQYYNDLVSPVLFVPKLTEQMWVIRAPYGKQIQIDKLLIDLVAEESCSKALITIQEQNGSTLANLCGSFDKSIEKKESSILLSQSNEITIKFTTQQTGEVVYRSDSEDDSKIKLYRGFRLAYSFVETNGDCYFQSTKSPSASFCDYKVISTVPSKESLWLISGANPKQQIKLDELTKDVLTGRYVKAIVKDSDAIQSALVSPIIKRTKRFFKFDYTFDGPLNTVNSDYKFQVLILKIANNTTIESKDFEKLVNSAIIKKDLKLTNKGSSAKIRLLKSVDDEITSTSNVVSLPVGNYLYSDYRVMFLLKKMNTKTLSKPITVTLDNFQSLDHDIDCNEYVKTRFGNIIKNIEEWSLVEDTCENSLFDSLIDTTAKPSADSCQKYVSPCNTNKCSPKGTLVCLNKPFFMSSINDQMDYICKCKYGYTGSFCEQKIDPCKSIEFNKCKNNATCESDMSSDDPDAFMSYKCKCKLNFIGRYCEESISPCKKKSNICNQLTKQGTCVDKATQELPDRFACICEPAFSGNNCEKKLDSFDVCSDKRCNSEDKNATCIKTKEGPVCICSKGFEGNNCTRIDKCINNPCKHNGVCLSNKGNLECKCKLGYSGKFCEIPTNCSKCNKTGTWFCDYGLRNTTKNLEDIITPKCICHKTHSGEFCDKIKDLCGSNRCNGKGYCISDKVNQTKCICNEGFTGKFCEKNETICDLGYCLNGATCIPNNNIKIENSRIHDSFSCLCPDEFTGKFCEKKIDKCNKLRPCQNGGTCFNLLNADSKSDYFCECPVTHSGKNCEVKVDFCAKNKCPYDSLCFNLETDYECRCPVNKFGRHCEFKQDKCVKNACMHGRCVEENEYLFNNMETTNTTMRLPYKCQCHPGYTGKFCEIEINECTSDPCMNGGNCVDLLNGYACVCPQNFTGKNCELGIFYCSHPATLCIHEHSIGCTNYEGSYKCNCAEGYTGARCEKKIDTCELNRPCFTGKCVVNPNNITDYSCVDCMSGYTGKNCERMIDFCAEFNPCQNDGICYSKLNDYHCSCTDDFSGKNCTIPVIKPCLYNKCKNNSTCKAQSNGKDYDCECDSKHYGTYCQEEKTRCYKVDCKMGICEEKTGKCVCNPLYPSSFCKESMLCDKMNCLNGGTCVSVVVNSTNSEAKCLCPAGLTGKYCEKSIYCDKDLNGNLCGENSVECTALGKDGYQCKCKPNFTGPFCNVTTNAQAERSLNEILKRKEAEDKLRCSFGNSKQSKIFLGIAGTSLLIFTLIGFLIAHCSIRSYKNKLNKLERANSTSAFSLIHTNQHDANNNKLTSSATKSTMISNSSVVPKSPDSFSIPRPSIYPTPRH